MDVCRVLLVSGWWSEEEDPEISRTSLTTNFLGSRTSRPDPEKVVRTPKKWSGPQKSGPDPKKVVPDPETGVRTRKTGKSRGDGPKPGKTAVFPVSGGSQKSRKLPPDTRTVPKNDRLQLKPPPGNLCPIARNGRFPYAFLRGSLKFDHLCE